MKRYEQATRVITAFFAVLLGFGLKKLLDQEEFTPANAQWPCFFMSVLLFLRFLLGSSNHMWFEFVRPDISQTSTFTASGIRILNDFIFLVVFGLIGVAICYSTTLDEFLKLNLLLTGVALIWVVVYAAIFKSRKRTREDAIPEGEWGYWWWINLLQFSVVFAVLHLTTPNEWGTILWPSYFPGEAWDWSLAALVIVYFVIFIIDFRKQLAVLDTSSPGAQPANRTVG